MDEIKEKIKDLELALNYVCYDADLIPKLQTVWQKLELLQEVVNKNDNILQKDNNKETEQCSIPSVIIRCPVCKSENIEDNSTYESNSLYGSGFRIWKTSNNRCCNDCGVIFKPIDGNGL